MKKKMFIAVVLVSFLYGCVFSIDPVDRTEQIPSIGQELIDLKKALDEGAITESEYYKLKQEIMDLDKHK